MESSIDFETIPNKDLVDSLPEPEYKYGNAKQEHLLEEIRKKTKEKQISDMALDPMYGRICSYAVANENTSGGVSIVEYSTMSEISDSSEIVIIDKALQFLRVTQFNKPTIITFNGVRFDIPFLYKRAMLLNVPLPPGVPKLNEMIKRYQHIPHCDLAMELVQWDTNRYQSLDNTCRAIIGKRKMEFDCTKIHDMILAGESSKISEYNMIDTELTMELYLKIKEYIF